MEPKDQCIGYEEQRNTSRRKVHSARTARAFITSQRSIFSSRRNLTFKRCTQISHKLRLVRLISPSRPVLTLASVRALSRGRVLCQSACSTGPYRPVVAYRSCKLERWPRRVGRESDLWASSGLRSRLVRRFPNLNSESRLHGQAASLPTSYGWIQQWFRTG